MRSTYRMTRLSNAMDVVGMYGIDKWFKAEGHGTASGFAKLLFSEGKVQDLYSLAHMGRGYLKECSARGTAVVDAEIAEGADGLEDVMRSRDEERAAFAAEVRKLRREAGDVAWKAVAQMATSDRPAAILRALPGDARGAVKCLLAGFLPHASTFCESECLYDYRPGKDHLFDHMLRTDIERLDTQLEAAVPWAGNEDDDFYEVAAILRLMEDAAFAKAMEFAGPIANGAETKR